MKKILLRLTFCVLLASSSQAQIICIFCYDQNDSISDNVNNLLINGGFENNNCIPNNWFNSSFCPNSSYYSCDIVNWTCTGGGSSTYADICDVNYSFIPEGTFATYFGSFYCQACSTNPQDTSCITTTDCTSGGIPPGFPTNDPAYGGSQGLSIEQTVSGLTIGATYVLEFWAGGEFSFGDPGLFGLDIGFGYTYLRNNPSPSIGGVGKRYIVVFNATATSHAIKFTNWGHICNTCTELILDDVRLYTLAELSPNVPPCAGANVTVLFSAPNHICPGTCTDFTNLSVNATSFLWSFPGGNPAVSSDASPAGICYNTPGTYPVTLIGSNGITSDTLTLNNYITVYPWPPAQGISQNGDTLFANPGAVSYQWYENGIAITGATNYYYIALESGNYNVVATDNNDCEVEAVIFDVIAEVNQVATSNSQVEIYPNPVINILHLKSNQHFVDGEIKVYDLLGGIVQTERLVAPQINVSTLSEGLYWLEILSGNKNIRVRFTKSNE